LEAPKKESRINGGKPVDDDSFRFQVSLQLGGFHYCSGVIIDDNYVLTAASCVVGHIPKLISVHYGSYSRTLNGRRARVNRIIAHPEFDNVHAQNDIALIEIQGEFEGPNWKRAKLRAPLAESISPGAEFYFAGWGYLGTASGNLAQDLEEAKAFYMHPVQCAQLYNNLVNIDTITDNQLCIGNIENGVQSLCHGDAGGALLQKDPWRPGNDFVYGIASFGNECGNDKLSPSVFTSVANQPIKGWIEGYTGPL